MKIIKCQVQTPDKYVDYILDIAGYNKNIVGKKVLENSFGEGNFLVEIVRRYIIAAKKVGIKNEEISSLLGLDIIGYEIDSNAFERCLKRLNRLIDSFGIPAVKWKLYCKDFLQSMVEKVDFVIGNPPYITYHDLRNDQRVYLKKNFSSCQKGRFDYFYAFLEKSMKSLSARGVLSYLIPYSFITNKSAIDLRKMIVPYLSEIVDYRSVDVFHSVLSSPIVLVCKKFHKSDVIQYEFNALQKKVLVTKERIIYGFDDNRDVSQCELGKVAYIKNSIATLRNEIFVFEESRTDADFFYLGEHKIERVIVRDAVSPKSLSKGKKMKIIFPYKEVSGKFRPLEEEELFDMYPCAYQYLASKKEILCKRAISDATRWYEFGRRQALEFVNEEKIVMPSVITGQNKAYIVPVGTVPYAGIIIVPQEKKDYSLHKLLDILLSLRFYQYMKMYSTPTVGNSFRFSVETIKHYKLS